MLFSFLLYNNIQGQTGDIEGNVYFRNGVPAEFVTVYVINESSHSYTSSDSMGYFQFKNIPYGEHQLGFKHMLREAENLNLSLDKSLVNIDHTLDFNETIEMKEVLVEGESYKTEVETMGYAVNVVEMKEIELQSLQATEVLDRTSGVRIRQNGGMGSRINFNINGLSGNDIKVFINDSPISSFGPSFSISSIPTTMIERIEVYKGVVPVTLAGDALGGAINIILKEDFDRDKLEAFYSYGSFNTHQLSASGKKYVPNSGLVFEGSLFHNNSDNNYKVWGNQVYTTDPMTGDITYLKATRFHDTYTSSGVKLDVGIINKPWADKLMVGTVLSSLNRDIQHGATMESVYGNRNAEQKTNLISLTYNSNNLLPENKLSLELFSSCSHLKRQIMDTIPLMYDWDGKTKEQYDFDGKFLGYFKYMSGAEAGDPTLEENIEKVYIGRATTSYRITNQQKFTVNFLHTRFIRDSSDPLRHIDIRDLDDTRYSNRSILGFGYNVKFLEDKLETSLFYKYFNQNIQIIEYLLEGSDEVLLNDVERSVLARGLGATISYELFPKFIILISAENSFRLPVARELFGNLAQNLEPNYDLKPERSKNFNFGATLGTFTFAKHEIRFKFNAFIRDTEDKIKRNVREDDTDETTEYINDDSYLSRGFDADLFYSFNRKLDLVSNLSIFNSRFNTQYDETGLAYTWYRDRERNAPFYTANIDLGYTLLNLFQDDSRTKLMANYSYVHWFYRDWESLGGAGKDIIPTQKVYNLGVSHTFPNKKLSISFDAKNILNRQVFDNYALQRPGRALYFKINYSFI